MSEGEQPKLAYDGWKDLHTWTTDDVYHWVMPATLAREVRTTNDLPDIVQKSGIEPSSLMLVTSIANAIGEGTPLDNKLTDYAQKQINVGLEAERRNLDVSGLTRKWLWNLRQLGIKGIPNDYGARDLDDHEVYEYRSALQRARVHPLKWFDGKVFSKILTAFSAQEKHPFDLWTKFYEREAFLNALNDPEIGKGIGATSIYEAIQQANNAFCQDIEKYVPIRSTGLRSKEEDKVSLRIRGSEQGEIDVTPPHQVRSALAQIDEFHNAWLATPDEHRQASARQHFMKLWGAIRTIQPLHELNTRTGFVVAANRTKKYLGEEFPDAFTGNDYIKGQSDVLFENRDPITFAPTHDALNRFGNIVSPTWIPLAQFRNDIRENGFVVDRPWIGKMKWRE